MRLSNHLHKVHPLWSICCPGVYDAEAVQHFVNREKEIVTKFPDSTRPSRSTSLVFWHVRNDHKSL